MGENKRNLYAEYLYAAGYEVIRIDEIDWYGYHGFIMPAYLPHCVPNIHPNTARKAVRLSGRPFARWDSEFGRKEPSDWWYVLKRGEWNIESISDKKKRWMIRQGQKNFTVRKLTREDILKSCPLVAQKAAARYKGEFVAETQEAMDKQVATAVKVPGVLEYVGCFHDDTLVSYSENYIQDNAVFLANIRHDPAFLNQYSSYGLLNGLLEYYLNGMKFRYVLDGCRSIYHKTQFQDHLMKVFGFTKEYALLNVAYSRAFGMAVKLTYPFRSIVKTFADKTAHPLIQKINGILAQEHIRRSF